MVISFSSFQCKRAHPPHLEDVIAIRKIRERRALRKRRIEEIRPLGSFGASLSMTKRDDVFYREYTADYVVPAIAETMDEYKSVHIDPVTKKRFKLPNAPSSVDITNMFKFYGIGDKIHKCPACGMEGNMRSLLPHLNNIDRAGDLFKADEGEYLGERTPEVDKPVVVESVEADRISGEIWIPSGGRVGIVEPIRSHGWNFKQIGEWMNTLGY